MGCASEDAESLHEAVEALRRDGLEVELCPGLDGDPKRLSEVIDRHTGRGLYVLCRSPALGREQVEELREILLARHVPFGRTLTVTVSGRGALADRIRSGLRRASARNSGPNRAVNATEDEEPTLVGKRDGVPESLELVPSQPLPPPPRIAPGAKPSMGVAASVPTGVPVGPPPTLSDDPPPVEISVVEAIDADLLTEDTSASWSGGAIASLDLSDLDEGNTGPTRMPRAENTSVGKPPPLITGDTVIGPAPAIITGDTLQGEKLPRALREAAGRFVLPAPGAAPPVHAGPAAHAAAELDPATMPLPRLAPAAAPSLPPLPAGASSPPFAPATPVPAPSAPAPSAPAFASPPPIAPAPSAPAFASPPPIAPAPSAAAFGSPPPSPSAPAFASPPPFASPPATAWASSAGASASASATSASLSHGDAQALGRGKALPWVLGGVALLLLVLVIALAVSNEQATSEVAAADEAQADSTPSPTPSPAETKAAEQDAAADDPAAAEPPVYPVVTALAARKVRALDVLLIATAWGKPSDYPTAVAYCSGLEIEGLGGWRLPHIGELHSLSQANMIARGMFWSSTAADTFGDARLAWNARRGHALPYAEPAVAVCVRGEASGS